MCSQRSTECTRRRSGRLRRARRPSVDGSGPSGTYRGADFKNAYAPVALTGTGQMVGLLEFDRYYPNDIALYATQASLSPVPPRIDVFLDEIQTALPTPGSGNVEVAWA